MDTTIYSVDLYRDGNKLDTRYADSRNLADKIGNTWKRDGTHGRHAAIVRVHVLEHDEFADLSLTPGSIMHVSV